MEDPLDFIAFGYVPGGVALVCFYVWVGFGNEEEDDALDVWKFAGEKKGGSSSHVSFVEEAVVFN